MARQRRPEITLNFDDTHVLLWDTSFVNYEFVHQLNEVFSLRLSCEPDIAYYTDDSQEILCSRYAYYDELTKLLYVVIDNPVETNSIDPALKFYDKILFVLGRDAREVCHQIHHDVVYGVQTDDPYNLRLGAHAAAVAQFRNDGIVQVDYLGFDVPEGVESSLLLQFGQVVPPKVRRQIQSLVSCIQSLFQSLSDTMEMEEID